jgi:hypothetical protein
MAPASEQLRICAARRRSGWGPRLIAGESSHPHATGWRTLPSGALKAPSFAARQRDATSGPAPATSLHIDSKRFTRFSRPGHAVAGIRDRTGAEKRMRIGHEFVHAIVDDHSRLA